jgi:antitoxin CcdA
MGTATVSAKIPEELKELLDEADVNISEAIREALEAETRERRRADLKDRVAGVESSMNREEIADVVREDRENR